MQPASTRTSFTRVDHTRPGTAVGDDGQRDGADPNDEDAPLSLHDEPEEHEEEEVIPQVPQTTVQFLLVSGRRRSMAFEPETTVGRVKELVWNTWPNGTFSISSLALFSSPLPMVDYFVSTTSYPSYLPRNSTPIHNIIAHAVVPLLFRHLLLVSGILASVWGGKGGLWPNSLTWTPVLTLRQTGRTSAHRLHRSCASSI